MISKNQSASQRRLLRLNRRRLYNLTLQVIVRLWLRADEGKLSKYREGLMNKRLLAWEMACQWGNGWQVARALDQAKRWLDFDESQNGKMSQ
jgi:dsRNA-specific ribonuclease